MKDVSSGGYRHPLPVLGFVLFVHVPFVPNWSQSGKPEGDWTILYQCVLRDSSTGFVRVLDTWVVVRLG